MRQDLDHAGVSPLWQTWAQEALLPQVGGASDPDAVSPRKAKMQQALEVVSAACATHVLTQCLPPQALEEWHAWATRQVQAFQRASSAVEGRNGSFGAAAPQSAGIAQAAL